MIHLDLVLEHRPEAAIVRTHRDPLKTLPSLASMSTQLGRLASDDVDPGEAALDPRLTARHRIEGLLEARRCQPEEQAVRRDFATCRASYVIPRTRASDP